MDNIPRQNDISATRPARAWVWCVLVLGLVAVLIALYVGHRPGQGRNIGPAGIDRDHADASPAAAKPAYVPVVLREVDALPAEPAALAGCNLLLVTLDTTRADHIGCYGYEEVRTPTLDRLASEGAVFWQAMAVAPTTLPSHATILTGLYPVHHGVRVNWFYRLDESQQTLAEMLGDNGYRTAAFISAFVLRSRFGLAQGFHHFDDDLHDVSHNQQAQQDGPDVAERKGDETTTRALRWLQDAAEDRFFLWVHYFDPHAPYEPPSPYAEQYADNYYDGEIAFADAALGKLIAALDGLDLTDRTLVVVVGDHGEGLGQHEESSHGNLVYESTIRVPLIMRCGRRLGGGVKIVRRVSQVDVVPTVLALLGLQQPDRTDGVNLADQPEVERPIFVETLYGLLFHGWAPIVGVYDGDLKYIEYVESSGPELFDLSKDPAEQENLCETRPDVAARLRGLLPPLFGPDLELVQPTRPQVSASAADLRKLEALGYIGGAGDVPEAQARRNPRESLPILNRILATDPIASPEHAISVLRPIVEEHPDFHAAWKFLGKAYRSKGDRVGEVDAFHRCCEIRPGAPETTYALARVRVEQGEFAAAIPLLEDVVARYADYLPAQHLLGTTLHLLGRHSEAAERIKTAFDIDPETKECVDALVALLSRAGRETDLRDILRQRLTTHPRSPHVCVALANHLEQQGWFGQAEAVLWEGVAQMPDNPEVVSAWALLVASCPDDSIRDPAAATTTMEQFCERATAPNPSAMYALATIYGSQKRYEEGLDLASRAKPLAAQAGNQGLVNRLNLLLSRLRTGQRLGSTKPAPRP